MSYNPNGSALLDPSGIAGVGPVLSQFSATNAGGSTATQVGSAVTLWEASSAGSGNCRVWSQTAPSTPYTITAFLKANLGPNTAGYNQFGIGFRRSSGGTHAGGLIMLAWVNNQAYANPVWQVGKWDSPTVYNADYGPTPAGCYRFEPAAGFFMRIRDDGTNLIFSVSLTGAKFLQLKSVSRTDFFSSGPDQVGFYIDPEADGLYLDVLSWVVGS